MKKWIFLSVACVLLLGACGFIGLPNTSSGEPMNNRYNSQRQGGHASNGSRFTSPPLIKVVSAFPIQVALHLAE